MQVCFSKYATERPCPLLKKGKHDERITLGNRRLLSVAGHLLDGSDLHFEIFVLRGKFCVVIATEQQQLNRYLQFENK